VKYFDRKMTTLKQHVSPAADGKIMKSGKLVILTGFQKSNGQQFVIIKFGSSPI